MALAATLAFFVTNLHGSSLALHFEEPEWVFLVAHTEEQLTVPCPRLLEKKKPGRTERNPWV